MSNALEYFGLPVVKEVGSFKYIRYVVNDSDKVIEGIAALLFREFVKQYVEQGYLNLDKCMAESKNEKVMKWREIIYKDTNKPYQGRKLFIVQLKLNVSDKWEEKWSGWTQNKTPTHMSGAWYSGYKNVNTYPKDLEVILSDIDKRNKDIDAKNLSESDPAKHIKKISAFDAVTKYFTENGFVATSTLLYYSPEIKTIWKDIISSFAIEGEFVVSNNEMLTGILSKDINKKIGSNKNDSTKEEISYSFDINDIFVFRVQKAG